MLWLWLCSWLRLWLRLGLVPCLTFAPAPVCPRARALLYPAPILLLDEATSALDSTTERQVLRALREHRAEETGARPTMIMIAHR